MMTTDAKKLLIQSILVGCVFAALLFLVILPKVTIVRKLAAEVRTTLAENQKLQADVLTAKHSGDRLDEIQGMLAQYKKKALYQEDLTRALDEIGSSAQKAGLSVSSLRALDEPRRIPGNAFVEGSMEIQQVNLSLKAEGQYPMIVQYLKTLEQFSYSADVQKVILKSASFGDLVDGEDPLLSVEIMIAVLMRVPPIKKTA